MRMSSEAHEMHWCRVRLCLCNTRWIAGRIEHPHHVIHAVLVPAVKAAFAAENAGPPVWCWQPHGLWPEELSKGVALEMSLFFPGRAAAVAAHFHRAFTAEPRRPNFRVESIHPPEDRSPVALEAGLGEIDFAADEICLDFMTPLAWEQNNKVSMPAGERWRLDSRRLVRMLHRRLAHFLGTAEYPEEAPLPAVEVHSFHARAQGYGHGHLSKSGSGTRMLFGLRGPIYLRGEWQVLWPQLLVCSELQLGSNTTTGQGHFRLVSARSHFDARLADPAVWSAARRGYDLHLAEKQREPEPDLPEVESLAALAAAAMEGTLCFTPARRVRLPKNTASPGSPLFAPDTREIALLPPPEQFIHFVLHRIIAGDFERLFIEPSIGSRRGRSRESAGPFVTAALRDGFTHVVEADLADFFDEVDWDIMGGLLRRYLPRADVATLALLERCVRHPLADFDQAPLVRQRGILQGSPLSSLLANLYLHEWDIAMRKAGRPFVRYVDDILLFARGAEDAATALEGAAASLGELGLRFKASKTGVLEAATGFRYLGLPFGGEETAGEPCAAPFHRRVFLTQAHSWAGVDGGAIALREGDSLVHRIPLNRVEELVLLGAGGISLPLLERCLDRKIPVTFCSAAGHYHGTLYGDRREIYARIARHHQRHAAAGSTGCAALACRLVQAKLGNYLHWLGSFPAQETGALRRFLQQRSAAAASDLQLMEPAMAVAAIRGEEGAAAAAVFPWVHGRAPGPEWACAGRRPHERPDRWNLLLDTLSFLLFSHLNTLLRTRGLDPYLGFLHSPLNRYESLVCDLMEPFRARLDRFALWLVRVGILVPAMSFAGDDGKWGFNRDGWNCVLLEFEKHLDFAYAADHGRTFRTLVEHQVHRLRGWVDGAADLEFYAHPTEPWKKGVVDKEIDAEKGP